MSALSVLSNSEAATRNAGLALGRALKRLDGQAAFTVLLYGELGTGKTVLIRGVGDALGVGGRVRSPSFTLINEYETDGGPLLVHADLYRLEEPGDVDALGLDDYLLLPDTVLLVEWPERWASPPDAGVLRIAFRAPNEERRIITFRPGGKSAEECVEAVRRAVWASDLEGVEEVPCDE